MINWTYNPTKDELEYCLKVSKFRENMQSARPENKNKKRSKEGIVDSICNGVVGALGELAVSRITGIRWDGAMLNDKQFDVWNMKCADIGPFEVKTISYKSGNFVLNDNDKDWAIGLLAYAPNARNEIGLQLYKGKLVKIKPSVIILGYLPVDKAKAMVEPQVNMFNSGKFKIKYIVTQDKLKPVSRLNRIVLGLRSRDKTKPVDIKGWPPFYVE